MRDIRFRAWQDDEMYYQETYGVYVTKRFLDTLYEDCELMQFTGLYDKNNNPIYENDIIEFDIDEWGNNIDNKFIVKWDEENGCWNTGGGTNNECKIYKTVIGNIYENPGLLKL